MLAVAALDANPCLVRGISQPAAHKSAARPSSRVADANHLRTADVVVHGDPPAPVCPQDRRRAAAAVDDDGRGGSDGDGEQRHVLHHAAANAEQIPRRAPRDGRGADRDGGRRAGRSPHALTSRCTDGEDVPGAAGAVSRVHEVAAADQIVGRTRVEGQIARAAGVEQAGAVGQHEADRGVVQVGTGVGHHRAVAVADARSKLLYAAPCVRVSQRQRCHHVARRRRDRQRAVVIADGRNDGL